MLNPFRNAQSQRLIHEAHRRGLLDEQARDRALELLPAPVAWWWGINKLLLAVGTIQVLAGIVFFFAFNWSEIPAFGKFAVLHMSMLAAVGLAWWKGFEKLTGKVLLLSASLILGVMMAVFGQVYQTGADSFQLFIKWAILSLPWAICLRFMPMWLLWVVVLNTGLILFMQQSHFFDKEHIAGYILITLVNLFVFTFAKWKKVLNIPEMLLWFGVQLFSAIPVTRWIFDGGGETFHYAIASCLWLAIVGVGFWWFQQRQPNFHGTALTVLNLASTLLAFTTHHLLDLDEGGGVLIAGVLIICGFAAATFYLYQLRANLGGEA